MSNVLSFWARWHILLQAVLKHWQCMGPKLHSLLSNGFRVTFCISAMENWTCGNWFQVTFCTFAMENWTCPNWLCWKRNLSRMSCRLQASMHQHYNRRKMQRDLLVKAHAFHIFGQNDTSSTFGSARCRFCCQRNMPSLSHFWPRKVTFCISVLETWTCGNWWRIELVENELLIASLNTSAPQQKKDASKTISLSKLMPSKSFWIS